MKAYGLNNDSISIGRFAGSESFVERTIAIGRNAGVTNQSMYAVAIGDEAGQSTQGEYAIAIGAKAGVEEQFANSIIINATSTALTSTKAGLYIDPIRSLAKNSTILTIDPTTKEVLLGVPRLPHFATDAEALAFFTTNKIPGPLSGQSYFDTTKKRAKVYNGTKWVMLLDEDDYAKIRLLLPALPPL